jgi:hypothetical protein
MNTPKKGQQVWVFHFSAEHPRHRMAKASVTPRYFVRVLPEYLGKPNNEHWALVLKPEHVDKTNEGYGMAYKPERVYEYAADALIALRNTIQVKIAELTALLPQ